MFMSTTNYYFLLFLMLSFIILLVRAFIRRKRNIPVELFIEALRNENSGQFEAALHTYENALFEETKIRFQSSGLKNKIKEKLKVLHTMIEYKKSFHYTR